MHSQNPNDHNSWHILKNNERPFMSNSCWKLEKLLFFPHLGPYLIIQWTQNRLRQDHSESFLNEVTTKQTPSYKIIDKRLIHKRRCILLLKSYAKVAVSAPLRMKMNACCFCGHGIVKWPRQELHKRGKSNRAIVTKDQALRTYMYIWTATNYRVPIIYYLLMKMFYSHYL